MDLTAENLPILIASGILLAAMVLFGFRASILFFQRGETSVGVLGVLASALIGGTLVLAGLGFIHW